MSQLEKYYYRHRDEHLTFKEEVNPDGWKHPSSPSFFSGHGLRPYNCLEPRDRDVTPTCVWEPPVTEHAWEETARGAISSLRMRQRPHRCATR